MPVFTKDFRLNDALRRYWGAHNPEEERAAYADCRAAGLPPAYGEAISIWDDPAAQATMRDAVIAGLGKLGWPDPDSIVEDGASWTDTAAAPRDFIGFSLARYAEICWTTAVGETGCHGFCEVQHPTPDRIAEVIDRLRWVIGLPPVAERVARPQHGPLFPPADHCQGSCVAVCNCGATDTGGFDMKEFVAAARAGIRESIATAARPTPMMNRLLASADYIAGLVPLPRTPEPPPERPYEPRKLGEF